MSAAYQAQSCRCPASTGPSRHRCVHIPAGRPHSQCAVVCHAQQPGDTPADSGDRRLQEELIDMLQLEVAKAKVKEDIREDIEKRKESMRQIGREVRRACRACRAWDSNARGLQGEARAPRHSQQRTPQHASRLAPLYARTAAACGGV